MIFDFKAILSSSAAYLNGKSVFLARVLAMAVAVSILSFVVLTFLVEKSSWGRTYSNPSHLPKNAVGLVFWTSKYFGSGEPNAYFESRIRAASELYREGRVDCLIVSGDNSTHEYNEVRELQLSLMEKGVPPERIIPDYAGFRTLDSVVRAKEVFGQSRLTLVTQESHAKRALFLARSSGIDAVAFLADDPEPSISSAIVSLRELAAWSLASYELRFTDVWPKFLGDPVKIEMDPSIRPVPEKICFPR